MNCEGCDFKNPPGGVKVETTHLYLGFKSTAVLVLRWSNRADRLQCHEWPAKEDEHAKFKSANYYGGGALGYYGRILLMARGNWISNRIVTQRVMSDNSP